ncbi:alpha/beta fold hydrolase [Alkalibacter rhizosphaerae]|uniref:Alpha/beta fold hydrolase n=1 Tax=Alkalibacter rhizosphaerae TaxID=2815577 RepID=A0A975AHP7_9FIRM|nr:alpha/beta fold hydrolase [Alkalibacter rhizosphaerae]QSX07839.1 alpha/beta fold hydrolase [Alkalibacter rhizosphaerae]
MDHNRHVLFLHGFGGGPQEAGPLRQLLENEGYQVSCPVLAGHEDIPDHLARVKYDQWIDSARVALEQTEVPAEEVVVIGFSMGGLIATNLSVDRRFKALITINTPVDFWNLPQVVENLMEDVKKRSVRNTKRYLEAKKNSPVHAMLEFHRMLQKTKKRFGSIHCPLLVVQTKDDDTVGLKSPEYIYRKVSSRQKSIAYFSKGATES